MSPQETTALLSYCAGLDQWLKATGPDEAAMMAAGWSDLLRDVPLDFARGHVRSHYGNADARTIQPGDMLSAWRADRRRAEQLHDRDERRELAAPLLSDAAVQGVIPGPGATEYLAALRVAVESGKDPRKVSRPAAVRVLSLEGDVASRRCRFHDVCVCTHTECRDGWLDIESTIVNAAGRRYAAVERCPVCGEAQSMAEETGRARRPATSRR